MDPSVLRIIDANLNRAREGIRVLEEHARLVLNDRDLSERIKQLRHDLAANGALFAPNTALACRDIENDVGTEISTDTERRRASPADVASAAARRTSEALRCLEEYGKLLSPDAAARIESLRYRLYAIEQEAICTSPKRRRLREARLHVLLTEALCKKNWRIVAQEAIDGGADVIQLREKTLTDHDLLERAHVLREITQETGALLFINDRPDIARLARADGVHVGQTDLPIAAVRHIAGPTILVGTSTHSIAEAASAVEQQPDYIAVGPMFASPTKPEIKVQGPKLLRDIATLTDLPLVAIGGIDPANAAALQMQFQIEFGAVRHMAVAVCQAVIASDDPRAQARALSSAMSKERKVVAVR